MPIHNRFFRLPDGRESPALLQASGLLLQAEVLVPAALERFLLKTNRPIPSPRRGWALLDTGATSTCVDRKTLEEMGIAPIGTVSVGTAGGPVTQHTFPVRLRLPEEGLDFQFTAAIGADLSGQGALEQPIRILLGRDVLSRCVVVYNGPGGFVTIAY